MWAAAASVFLNQIPNGLRHSLNRKVLAMTAVTLPASMGSRMTCQTP